MTGQSPMKHTLHFLISAFTNLFDLLPQLQEVLKALRFLSGIAQQRCRMIGAHHINTVALDPLAVLFRYFKIRGNDPAGSNPSKTHNDLRADDRHLIAQKADTLLLLLRQRIPVFRRTAFDDIGNIDVLVPVQIHHRK